ncbi:alpha/beta-hydrolase [Sparassis latifolia]
MSPPSSTLQWILLALPTTIIVAYLLTAFPITSAPLIIYPSLNSLPDTSPSWKIYPEDCYNGGAYARLPHGNVRYWLIGPEDGERVVLIHGLSVPAFIWKDVAPHLAENGFRVLLYDLYGRGYTDAPETTYDTNLYTTQLAMLMQYVGWNNAHVAGVSMGGGIATAFSAQFPHLVSSKLALIASTGLAQPGDLSRTSKFLSSPLMQQFASTFPFRWYLQYLARCRKDDAPADALIRLQSAYLPGFNPAVASSLRDGPVLGLAPAFAQLGRRTGARVLLMWGTADRVVPFVNAARVKKLIPHAELVTIEGAGHSLTMSHPQEVGRTLVRFFRQD